VVCEGKTERNYFNAFKREDEVTRHFAITVKRGKGGSREQIAQSAVEHKDVSDAGYEEVWCVMDVETPAERPSLDRALTTLQQNGIKPCLSNPAFEVWLLAHFEKTAKPFQDCDAVVAQLKKHWQKDFSADYDKADRDIFRRVRSLTDSAISNAQWVRESHHGLDKAIADCNSGTEVYLLIKRLSGNLD